jgi:hypothetical protein
MYGLSDNPSDPQSIVYRQYNALVPNNEGHAMQYPISFQNTRIKDGCMCYNISLGSCKTGISYLSKE